MKQTITLSAFAFFVTLFSFGQKTELKNNEKFEKYEVVRQLKGIKQDEYQASQVHSFKKNINFFQNSTLKSAQSFKQRLDSCVWQGWDRTIEQWMASTGKVEYTYDSNGNTLVEIESNWDETSGQWYIYWKGEYTYNIKGELTQNLFSEWNENKQKLEPVEKSEFTYDVNGNMNLELNYVWNNSTSQWNINWRYEYGYDKNGNMTQIVDFKWEESTSEWIFDNKIEYSFDEYNRIITEAYLEWNSETSAWKYYPEDGKSDYTYNSEGKMIEELYYVWDETLLVWKVSWKTTYTYNNDGNLIQRIGYDWDEINSLWIAQYRRQFIYDNDGNNTWLDSEWDSTNNQWVFDVWKREMTYDYSYTFSDLILPPSQLDGWWSIYNGVYFHNKLETITYFQANDAGTEVVKSGKNTYFYSLQNISSVSEIIGKEVFIYPNPVSDNISFHIQDYRESYLFELFDIQGRKIAGTEVNDSEIINISFLKSGIYLFKLSSEGINKTGKLMKQ